MHGKERCGLDSTGTTGSGIVGTGKAYITPGIIADMLRLLYAAETILEGSSMLPQCSVLPLYPHSKQPSAVARGACRSAHATKVPVSLCWSFLKLQLNKEELC